MGLPRGSFGFTQPDGPDSGLRLGKITRVTSKGAFVEVASLAKGQAFGPCRYPADMAPTAETLEVAAHSHSDAWGGTGAAGAHEHGLRPLKAGDTVLCAFLAGGHDELVVVVRLT